MHTILVTGAAGYIGSITTDLLLSSGYRVVALDNFSRGYRGALDYLKSKYPDTLIVYESDLVQTGGSEVFAAEREIAAVIHFAALLNVGESWKVPQTYFSNNLIGTQRLAESAIAAGVKPFIFSSSCTVYGNAQYTPIDEQHPIAEPVTPYGASKQMCEQFLTWYSKMKLLNTVFLRYFNVCGATDDGAIGDSKHPSFHLVQNIVRGALGIEPFTLNYATVATPDGSPIRDYVNVVDLADAHVRALQWVMQTGESNVFNIGTGTGNSVLEVVDSVKKISGLDFAVSDAPERRAGEADRMVADITKARSILGWEPRHTLAQSVDSLIRWYKARPQGWK